MADPIVITDLPDDVRVALLERALEAGLSLQDFLVVELSALVAEPGRPAAGASRTASPSTGTRLRPSDILTGWPAASSPAL